MAKFQSDVVKLIGLAFQQGGKTTTRIALVATCLFIFTLIVAIELIFIFPSVNQTSQWIVVGVTLLISGGIFILLLRFVPSQKQIPPQSHGAIVHDPGYLRDLAIFAQPSLRLVDKFCFHSINNLGAVKTACVTGQNLLTDAQ